MWFRQELIVVGCLLAGCVVGGAPDGPVLAADHITCFRDDPNFNECLRGTIQKLFTLFSKTGVPEYELPPWDPLYFDLMTLKYHQTGIRTTAFFRNATTVGMGRHVVHAVRSNLTRGDAFYMEIDISLDKFFSEGTYEAEGSFFDLPVEGGGPYNMTVADVRSTWKLSGRFVDKNNRVHVELDKVDSKPNVRYVKLFIGDLVKGNKALGEAVLIAINLFWKPFYDTYKRNFADTWGPTMTTLINQIFSHVPYDQLFPLRPHQ